MTGDQQDQASIAGNRLLQTAIDRLPRAIEAHTMKIDSTVRIRSAGPKPPIPAAVERRSNTQLGSSDRHGRMVLLSDF